VTDGINTSGVIKAAVAATVIGTVGLGTLFGGYFTVGERERSVVTRNGKFQYVAGPGLHFKMPWIDTAYDLNVDLQTITINDAETYTSDSQKLFVDMVVLFQIPSSDAKVEQVYRELKDPNARLQSLALDRMKGVLGEYNAWGVPGKRVEVARKILDILKRDADGILQGLEVVDVQLPDISYTKEFQEAVNRATIAQTEAGRAEADQRRATIEQQTLQNNARSAAVIAETNATAQARQQVLAAEARAKATEVQARAEAESIRARGTAEAENARSLGLAKAEALKAENEALANQGPALVGLRIAEKWSGNYPQQMISFGGGDGKNGGAPMVPLLHMPGPDLSKPPAQVAAEPRR
jgi:regulator of protease activity HflC (stomatin/prohibitin superfamily)